MTHYKKQWCRDKGQAVFTHRVIWEKANGPIPEGLVIDHIDGNIRNNDLSNLRVITKRENHLNSKRSNNNTSGVTGVGWYKAGSKWRAYITVEQSMKSLGYFDDWFEAVCCRMSANNRYGFHPNHGRR